MRTSASMVHQHKCCVATEFLLTAIPLTVVVLLALARNACYYVSMGYEQVHQWSIQQHAQGTYITADNCIVAMCSARHAFEAMQRPNTTSGPAAAQKY